MISLLKLMPYTDAAVEPSPNHDARKAPAIQGIVLHATEDGGYEAGTLSWLRSPKSQASCHLLVSRTGEATRLVGDHQRAWHAGQSRWRDTNDVNSITLGIEISNRNNGEPFTDAQYNRVAAIVTHYCRQGLLVDDVVSHATISENRRTDPVGWDWSRFRALVEEQLRPAEVEIRTTGVYDRRSGESLSVPSVVARVAPPPRPTVPAKPANPTKSGLCSRTLWVNGLTTLAAGGVILAESLDLAFYVGFTVPENVTMWILFAIGLVNIVLRYQTTCAICSHENARRATRPTPLPKTTMAVSGRARIR